MPQPYGKQQRSLSAQTGLIKRLSNTQSFKGHSSTVNALDWSSDGEILLSGSDDCRIKLWNAESGKAMHTFDSGHTSSIYVSKFLPNTGNAQIITSAADRQIRLVDLERSAIKPYTFHHGKVKALVALDPCLFISGSDDGTVRHYDTRERSDTNSTNSLLGMRSGDVLADQKFERTPRGRAKVGINAVAVDSMRPHLFVTGSSDPMVRLYDRRMSGRRGHSALPSGRNMPQWVSCYIPTSLKTDALLPRSGPERPPFISSVKFSVGGDQVFASYSGDNIYSFLSTDHARASEAYCEAQGVSRPSSAFGTRSASRHAILNISADALGNGRAQEQAAFQNSPNHTQNRGNGLHTAGTVANDAPASHPSSGGLSTAAAAAVARIRAHRAATRAPGSTTEAATQTAADWNPLMHQLPLLPGSSTEHNANPQQPAQSSELFSASAAVYQSQHNSDLHSNALGDASGCPVPTADEVSRGGLAADRLAAAPRPPLPFHPIRRSARLHKSAGNSADELPQQVTAHDASTAGACAQGAAASKSPEATENAGPCTRHSCKRKLAQMSGTAPAAAEKHLPSTHQRQTHMASLSHAQAASAATPLQSAAAVTHSAAVQVEQSDAGRITHASGAVQQTQADARHGGSSSLHAQQHGEGCVASSRRRLEQPTASTGTSRPVPLLFAGAPMPLLQARDSLPAGPPDFLRLQYSTNPPSSAETSRENTPDIVTEAAQTLAQPAQRQPQAEQAVPDLPRPNRLTRRARASRLAPLPASITGPTLQAASSNLQHPDSLGATSRQAASANLPPWDPLDTVSRKAASARMLPSEPSDVISRQAASAKTLRQSDPVDTASRQAASANALQSHPVDTASRQAASGNALQSHPADTASRQAASANLMQPNPLDSASRQAGPSDLLSRQSSDRAGQAQAFSDPVNGDQSGSGNLPQSRALDTASKQAAPVNMLQSDPSEILSRQSSDGAGQSQAFSDPVNGPAVSTSGEARPDSCHAMCHGDLEPPAQQPREGTPVSSNRQPYRARARGRASVEASTAPKAPTWHASSSSLPATADPSGGSGSPRGSRTVGRQMATSDIRQPQPEADPGAACPADDEVLSPPQEQWVAFTSAEAFQEAEEVAARNARALAEPRRDGLLVPNYNLPRLAWHRMPQSREWAESSPGQNAALRAAQQGQTALQSAQRRHTAVNPSADATSRGQAEQGTRQHSTADQQQHSADRPALQASRQADDACASAASAEPDQAAANGPARAIGSSPEADANGPARAVGSSSRANASGPLRVVGSSPEADANCHLRAIGSSPEADTYGPSRAVASSPERSSMPGPSHSIGAPGTDHSRDGQLRQFHDEEAQLAGVVDSIMGALVQDSDDEADGEVVEERGIFHRCYKGHCNLSQTREVCLMGSRDEFVVSGSDDGRIFIWDQHTTRLVNMLTSNDHNIQCVAPHPSMPVLASAGSEPVVKLWSPQAETPCCLERAEAIMSHNAQELAEGDRRSNPAGPQPLWLNMLGTAVSAELRAPGEAAPARNTNPVRCTIM